MIYGFRVWQTTSCQDNGSPGYNDFYFNLDGGLDEQRAARIAARCSEFVAQQCGKHITFYGVNSFPAPMRTWFATPDNGCFWFPAKRMHLTGVHDYNVPEGALHLCLRKWAPKAPGHFMIWGALDQSFVSINDEGKVYLNGSYNRARLTDTWGLISNLATSSDAATPIVATHGPGYSSISQPRQITHIGASGVSDLRAIERAGYFQGYTGLQGTIQLSFIALAGVWDMQYELRDWQGLDVRFNPDDLKVKTQLQIGKIEGLCKLLLEVLDNPTGKDGGGGEGEWNLRTGPTEENMRGPMAGALETKCKAWSEDIGKMAPDIFVGVAYTTKEQVKELLGMIEEAIKFLPSFAYIDSYNPYVVLPLGSSEGNPDEAQAIHDKYLAAMKHYPSHPPIPPQELAATLEEWQQWSTKIKLAQHIAFKAARGY